MSADKISAVRRIASHSAGWFDSSRTEFSPISPALRCSYVSAPFLVRCKVTARLSPGLKFGRSDCSERFLRAIRKQLRRFGVQTRVLDFNQKAAQDREKEHELSRGGCASCSFSIKLVAPLRSFCSTLTRWGSVSSPCD